MTSEKFKDAYLVQPKNELIFEVDFAGHCKAMIKIEGERIKILKAMNGWGDNIPLSEVKIY